MHQFYSFPLCHLAPAPKLSVIILVSNVFDYFIGLEMPSFKGTSKWRETYQARDQARGRLGRNSRPRGQNFALNGTQGVVGVSLKKKKKKKKKFFFFFFFFRETHTNASCGDIIRQSTTTESCFSFHYMAIVCVMANLLRQKMP